MPDLALSSDRYIRDARGFQGAHGFQDALVFQENGTARSESTIEARNWSHGGAKERLACSDLRQAPYQIEVFPASPK
jgi:hypothetical protein